MSSTGPPWSGNRETSPLERTRNAWRLAWAELPATRNLPPGAAALAQRQGLVLSRLQARDAGITDADLRRELRAGRWSAPRRGVISPLPRRPSMPGSPGGLAPPVMASAAAAARRGTVISHASAAQLRYLPLLRVPGRPILTAMALSESGGRPDVLVHFLPLAADERTTWFGASVTSVARTIIDIARTDGVAAGLVVADAALAEQLVEPEELLASLAAAAGRRGVPFARRVVELADPRAESPLESLTRLVLIEGGIAADPQRWLETRNGWFRVDLLVDERVVIEADGLLKYRGRPAGEDDPLVREKLRQEAIEQAGYGVVRVSWSDIRARPAETVRRVRSALARHPRPGMAPPHSGPESGRPVPGQRGG